VNPSAPGRNERSAPHLAQVSPRLPAKPVAPAPATQAKSLARPGGAAGDQSAESYHAAGRKFIQEGKWAEAIAELDKAIAVDPTLAQAFNARGFARFRLRNYAGAIADFDRALVIHPRYANAYTNRAAARKAKGDAAGAEADMQKARALLAAGAR
jgi:tetratricopeptide (TPR) repeat protein